MDELTEKLLKLVELQKSKIQDLNEMINLQKEVIVGHLEAKGYLEQIIETLKSKIKLLEKNISMMK